jgi:hypothetical protein
VVNIPFTQTKEYLSWHNAIGTKTFYKEFCEEDFFDVAEERDFQIDNEKEFETVKKLDAIVAALVIELRIGKVLYVPYGPVFFGAGLPTADLAQKVLSYLQVLGQKQNCVFVRLEDKQGFLSGQKYLIQPPKKTFAKEGIFQPRTEWWLTLSDTEENIYNNFHKDHRYSIRRAQKEGIQTEMVDFQKNSANIEKYFETFWKLLKETSKRDGFSLYDEKYYKEIFNNSLDKTEMKKFLILTKSSGSTREEECFSAALVVVKDRVANLVFAGSVREGRGKGRSDGSSRLTFTIMATLISRENVGCDQLRAPPSGDRAAGPGI